MSSHAADYKVTSYNSSPAIMVSIQHGEAEMFKELLDNNKDVSTILLGDSVGETMSTTR